MSGESEVFGDPDELAVALRAQGYIPDRHLATIVFLVTRLGKPVLIEGPAGVGKTELAKALAAASRRRLLRLQCYEGQDETKALYEWDYGKQLLYTQILREHTAALLAGATDLSSAVEKISSHEAIFFSEHFLAERPLLAAVRSPEPVVLLIDEVDRADEALEAVLLELLAEFQVSVPEIGTFRAGQRPWVVITSNNTRDLSAALKRRCLHLGLDYPSTEREVEIIRSKGTGASEALTTSLVGIVRRLRALDLRKPPSISETVDWAQTLAVLGVEDLDAGVLADTISVILKYERDIKRALEALPSLVPLEGWEHHHVHDHPHAHDHPHIDTVERDPSTAEHSNGKDHAASDDENEQGALARRDKDRPGRFDRGYYGTPDLSAFRQR